MHEAASQLNIQLIEVFGDRHWKKMLREGQALLTNQSLDYLVLVNEHQKAGELMRLAEKQGVPTFLLLNGLGEDDPASVYGNWKGSLIPDNHSAGREMAESLFKAHSGAGKLFTLVGDTLTPASLDRTSGLDAALALYPGVHEILRGSGQWSESVAYNKTKLLLNRETPEMVWAANDNIALGAIRALKETGVVPGKDVSVVGLNWSKEGLASVEKGELLMTHGGHFMAGAWMMVLVYDDYHRLGTAKTYNFQMSAITSRNIKKYQACFGEGRWDSIDFKRFSRTTRKKASTSPYEFSLSRMMEYARGC
ncbi:sugar ABC transporter substrate-binding protein [Litoribrevibacter albus]|uniref:Sugar ABC transporter substrate-binding protein n=2 Tax=Litoribrevibacter albus TaxID=1473156 RepID=A0AA37SFI3_9GAMM|nr:sugar ABC transporter substrate-binding protein [Litoribrevibacter albus]